MYQMKRGRSSAEIEAPFQLRVPLISTSLTNGDAHGHGSICCSGRPWPTPRLFTVVVCVLICGIFFTFLNIYELHKMRNAGNSSGFVDTTSKNGPVAWLHGKNMQSGYLKHVENVFERVGYTVVTEKPGKWDAFWSHAYPFQVLKDDMKNTRGNQRVNHFPGSGFITNKVSLATLSSKYIPKAFQLPDEKQAALAYAKEFPEKMFVQKNNKHRGISVQKLGDIDLETPGNFVQEYVSDPFLIDGHKFDIGVYVALTSVDPLRVYVFEGDVLFRFCPEKYLPFDPVNLNKYVVGDDYLPVWKVPSLKKYFSEMGLGMRESSNAYLRSKGRTPETIWRDVKLAIQEIFLKKEPLFVNLISKYPYKEAFFEMMRFDFVLDEDLNPYLMEANMSPNLSSSHFPPNRFLYEQVLYNLFSLVGLARRIKSDTLSYRSDDEEKMEVSEKEISVFHSLCASDKCASSCHAVECKSSCVHCFSTHEKEELKRAYKEHLNRGECRRILPMPMHRSEAKKELEDNEAMMLDTVANAIWHVFNFLDDKNTGLVVKSRLKVLAANLGTILNSYNVERGLDDFRSTPHLSFEHFKYYLAMELFSSLPSTLDLGTRMEYQHQIEELCWLVAKQSLLKRDRPVFAEKCVFQLFRIFCCLSEEIADQRVGVTFAMHVDELKRICDAFMTSVGRKFDEDEFNRVTKNTEFFTFPLMLEFIERRYGVNVEEGGAKEAIQDLYDTYALDVLKKGYMSKKGELFPTFREYWFVLKPFSLIYFSGPDEKDKKGEISLKSTLRVESASTLYNTGGGPDHGASPGSTSSLTFSGGSLGSMDKIGSGVDKPDKPSSGGSTKGSHKFSLKSMEKSYDFTAPDHRSKLQWISALRLALDHCDSLLSHQRSLANRRRRDREILKKKECEERQRRASQIDIMEKTKAQLMAEKMAREAAEAEARLLAKEKQIDERKLKELETMKEQLEKTLEEETQARRDEEIVRSLQARILCEEWDKREQLERLHEEQKRVLEEEKEKRRKFEQLQREREQKLALIERRLKELEEDRKKLDKELRSARHKVSSSEQNKEILEARLKARGTQAGVKPVQRQKSQNDQKTKKRSSKVVENHDVQQQALQNNGSSSESNSNNGEIPARAGSQANGGEQ